MRRIATRPRGWTPSRCTWWARPTWTCRPLYYASCAALTPRYGFYDYGGPDGRSHRTTPGEFGARASKLYELLTKGRYDVKPPPADLHRLAVWLDSCSMFYGVYEKEGGEAQLRGEIVRPTLE